jgi:hypothetical protein
MTKFVTERIGVKVLVAASRIMKQLDTSNGSDLRTRGLGIPIWLMGMSNLSYGFYNGIISFAPPQMLAATAYTQTT